jgi:uncharacterized protein YjbI with pentapeptide repeats
MTGNLQSHAIYAEVNFKGLRLAHLGLTGSEFTGCTFTNCSLVEAVLRDCRFVSCRFVGCDLSLVQLPGSSFVTTRFEKTRLLGVNWTLAHWPAAGLGNPVGFWGCGLNHSTFIGLSLHGLQLIDCAAIEVDFREADLAEADFGGSDLSGSLFMHTNLQAADLSRARDYTINPAENQLKGAKFSLPEAMTLLFSLDIGLVDPD